MLEHLLWTEAYRPKTVADCILPDRLKLPFQEYVNQKSIPSLLLHGSPGVGKTTVAKALCLEVDCDFIIINGSDESGIDVFRNKIKNYASSMSLRGGRKVIIIDEGDYLNSNSTQPALRSAMEEFALNCSFIFTCNFKNKIIAPLHSRCAVIDFTLQKGEKAEMAGKFFKKAEFILSKEQVAYKRPVLAEIIKKYFPDFRRALNELQRCSQYGNKTIDEGILAQLGDITITELVSKLKEKDFGYVRRWVGANELDTSTLYKKIYENLTEILQAESVPEAVLILANYQFKAGFVADLEINTIAMFTELMMVCKWK